MMREVTIYDVGDATRRRTIYADSGKLALAPNRRDLNMQLFSRHDAVVADGAARTAHSHLLQARTCSSVRDVANQFQSINADTASKGDREMSVCEMQKNYELANVESGIARTDSLMAVWRIRTRGGHHPAAKSEPRRPTEDRRDRPAVLHVHHQVLQCEPSARRRRGPGYRIDKRRRKRHVGAGPAGSGATERHRQASGRQSRSPTTRFRPTRLPRRNPGRVAGEGRGGGGGDAARPRRLATPAEPAPAAA